VYRELQYYSNIKLTTDYLTKLTNQITKELANDMQQSSSSEANSSLAKQKLFRILCNPSVHYHIQKSPLPLPTLRQINLVHGPLWLLKDPF